MVTKVGIVTLAAGCVVLMAGIATVADRENGANPLNEPDDQQGQIFFDAESGNILADRAVYWRHYL